MPSRKSSTVISTTRNDTEKPLGGRKESGMTKKIMCRPAGKTAGTPVKIVHGKICEEIANQITELTGKNVLDVNVYDYEPGLSFAAVDMDDDLMNLHHLNLISKTFCDSLLCVKAVEGIIRIIVSLGEKKQKQGEEQGGSM